MRVLVISRNHLELERIPLTRSSMTIGRSPNNDVVLRAPKVSPCHFLLEWVGTGDLDLSTSDWSVVDISNLNGDGSLGLMLKEGAAIVDGFKFELRDDKLEATPDIGGRVVGFSAEDYRDASSSNSLTKDLLEVMHVQKDSGSVEEVKHIKFDQLSKPTILLKSIPSLQAQYQPGGVKILLTQMPEASVYNRGQKIQHNGTVTVGPDDLLQIVWGRNDIYLRFVTRQKMPLVPRTVIVDPLLQKLFVAAVVIYIAVFGLIYAKSLMTPEPKVVPPPRVATVEIKTFVEAPPKPEVEKAPPPEVMSERKHIEQTPLPPNKKAADVPRVGIPNLKANNKAAEAAAPKFVKDPSVKSAKIGLDSPAPVTDTNTVGILGAFGKVSKGKGVSSDKILNQGVVTQTLSRANDPSAIVSVKNPPSGVLGTGSGGDPQGAGGKDSLAQASTTFAGSDKYNPKASGPIAREGAKGEGWEAGTSLGKGGSGLSGGSVSGRGDVGSIELGSFAVEGGLDKETVRRVINAHRGLLRTCYDRALLTNSKTAGRIVYQWQISASGPVTNSELKKSTMKNPSVESCVLDVIKQMQFPVASNGRSTTVIYPFEFRSKD